MQLYDKLLGLPLFQGMSSGDLQEVIAHVRFGFHKHNKCKTVIEDGQQCRGLMFLISGDVDVMTTSADHGFTLTESLSAPAVIQPEQCFGLFQRYTSTFQTRTQCHFIFIDKKDVTLLTSQFSIFRLNLLNIIATQSQRLVRQQWRNRPATTRDRVVRFLQSHASILSGRKVYHIKMQQLADEINVPRLEVSAVLNQLHDEGLIILQRGIITIPKLEAL